jgi:hypothetical protein
MATPEPVVSREQYETLRKALEVAQFRTGEAVANGHYREELTATMKAARVALDALILPLLASRVAEPREPDWAEYWETLLQRAQTRLGEITGEPDGEIFDMLDGLEQRFAVGAVPIEGVLRERLRREVHDAFLAEAESDSLPLLDRVLEGIDAALSSTVPAIETEPEHG